MGGDSFSKGRDFESWHQKLDGSHGRDILPMVDKGEEDRVEIGEASPILLAHICWMDIFSHLFVAKIVMCV